jgi:thiamine-monophosphate kinase
MEPNRPSGNRSSGNPAPGPGGGPAGSRGQGSDPFADSEQHTSISEVGEFGLIAHLREVLGEPADESVVSGISDDAAVYRIGDEGHVHLVTSDALLEGIHFDRTFMPMEHLGFKAMSVNVSDVVAMNAEPRYATVTLGIPQQMSVEMVGTLYEGFKKGCEAYDMTVIGGDTTGARGLQVSVTVIGEANEEDVVYRGGARVGDKVCVTGDVGASYAGLKVLIAQRKQMQEESDHFQPNLDPFSYVIRRHLAPPAQLKAIRDWAEAGVRPNAMIDISDGVSSEAHHIAEASGVGMQLYEPALPISVETRNTATEFGEDVSIYALFGGEDYELLFTLPEDKVEALDPQTFSVIGDVVELEDPEKRVMMKQADGENVALRPGGFDHFDEEE